MAATICTCVRALVVEVVGLLHVARHDSECLTAELSAYVLD